MLFQDGCRRRISSGFGGLDASLSLMHRRHDTSGFSNDLRPGIASDRLHCSDEARVVEPAEEVSKLDRWQWASDIGDPLRQVILGDQTLREPKDRDGSIQIINAKLPVIQTQEDDHRRKGGPLVSIDEWMILAD